MQNFSVTKIAKSMGRHRGMVYRELKRNSTKRRCGYTAFAADSNTRGRRRRSRRNRHYTEQHFKLVGDLLMKQWNPEQIVGYIRQHKLMQKKPD